ncbi:MAG: hypothetical protein ABR999_06010 [Methanoregula sp.]|jgi:hypothetical protein|uniref:DUF7288 family protein n=1 Tax=Methanoregula sp. TaxID=2052170 RepID=UPI003D0E6F27
MVNSDGQLYTIEGVAAGMIMLFTAYLVLGMTSVYTPGDSHISDMQLEQLGTDALRMMNTPVNSTASSTLQNIIYNNTASCVYNNGAWSCGFNSTAFNTTFLNYVNNKTGSKIDNYPNGLHYNATVTYYNISSKTTASLPLAYYGTLTGGEHPVRVTEWLIVNKKFPGTNMIENRAVLVEVLLWRD